jgi:hypothetical protein
VDLLHRFSHVAVVFLGAEIPTPSAFGFRIDPAQEPRTRPPVGGVANRPAEPRAVGDKEFKRGSCQV